MIDAQGTITAVEGKYAIVRMDETGCGRCHEDGGCGGNNIGRMFCSAPQTFRVLNPINAAIGDHVKVTIADGTVRRSAVFAYGFPLLALFVGAIGGSELAGEVGSIAGAVSGLLLAWLVLRYFQIRTASEQRSLPCIRH